MQKPWLKQHQPGAFTPYQSGKGWGMQMPWGKGGKGCGKSWGPPAQQRQPPSFVPDSFQVDQNVRHRGTVEMYAKWRGFGFVTMTQQGIVPTNKVFVHWRQILSDDRFPFLVKGMEVEFNLTTFKDFRIGGTTVRVNNLTQVGGSNVAMQDELDAAEKSFVGGQHLRYTGTLKFFSPKHGFGYVVMDAGYDVDPSVPSELRVDREEVNAGGQQPVYMQNLAVEFGIYRNLKMQHKVYNMTLPGGHPLTQDALENRISTGPQQYQGQVAIWNWRQGWGFLSIDPSVVLPPRVVAKLTQQAAAARARGKQIQSERLLYVRKLDVNPLTQMRQGLPVSFQLYIDDKGAGAMEVH